MTELRLDSRSIDSIQLSTYAAVCRVAVACEVPFLIVGASARDLVMHHGYGAHTESFYEQYPDLLESYDWDTRLCGSHLLGVHTARIARISTLSFLRDLLTDDKVSRLESDGRLNARPGGHGLLKAFIDGFRAVRN